MTYKYTNKRARNTKLASVFFKASAVYIRGLLQIYKFHTITSESRYYFHRIHSILISYFTLSQRMYKKAISSNCLIRGLRTNGQRQKGPKLRILPTTLQDVSPQKTKKGQLTSVPYRNSILPNFHSPLSSFICVSISSIFFSVPKCIFRPTTPPITTPTAAPISRLKPIPLSGIT